MKSRQQAGVRDTGWTGIAKTAIAVIALFAAGIAVPFFQGPLFAAANSRAVSAAAERPGGSLQSAVAGLIGNDPAGYSVSQSQAYCPVGSPDARGGSGKSLCDMVWGLEFLPRAISDMAVFSLVRAAAAAGASRLSPAISFIAGHCLRFLKQTLPL